MSRIGAMPIDVPKDVGLQIDGNKILINGTKGSAEFTICSGIKYEFIEGKLFLICEKVAKSIDILRGTYRSIISNFITGVSKGFCVYLDIVGVGYKADLGNKYLTLFLGFSHDIKYKIPNNIEIQCAKPSQIMISGFDKQQVYSVASYLSKLRKYDPYKGKGIVLRGVTMLRKEANKKK